MKFKGLHDKLSQIDYKGIPTIDVITQIEAIIDQEMRVKCASCNKIEPQCDIDRGATGHFSQGNSIDWDRAKNEGGIRRFQD
jgi:hypothetical protein